MHLASKIQQLERKMQLISFCFQKYLDALQFVSLCLQGAYILKADT